MTTDQRGAIAEAKIIAAAVELGVPVLRPVVEGLRYDLVLEVAGRLLRVQCKWANRQGDVLCVRSYSCRRTRQGMLVRRYTPEEIDAFAVYSRDLERCYYLPIALFPSQRQIHLRLAPARNAQLKAINWARDFEFAATLGRQPGAVAQLGERRAGSA